MTKTELNFINYAIREHYEKNTIVYSTKYMAQAGSTMLVFSVASWIIIPRLWVIILIFL